MYLFKYVFLKFYCFSLSSLGSEPQICAGGRETETSRVWNNDVVCGPGRDVPLPPCRSDKENQLEGIHPVRTEGSNWGR